MADLGTLALGTFTNVQNTGIIGSDPVLELIASADDADYLSDANNSTHTGLANFALADMPSDFSSMDTLAIRLRYHWATGSQVNTWNTLTARVFKSDGSTALTDLMTVASSITTTTATNSSVITFTGVDTAATASDWNGALVQIGYSITRNKGGDTLQKRVTAAEVTGTYTVLATPRLPSVNDTVTLAEFASVQVNFSRLEIATGEYVLVREGQDDLPPRIIVWDNVLVEEAYGVGGALLVNVSDDILVQDSPAVQPTSLSIAIVIFENVQVQEGQSDSNVVSASVFETVTVDESIGFNMNLLRVTVNDSVTVVDAPGVFAGGAVGIVVFENVLVQESRELYLTLYINAFDTISVVDGALAPEVFETITIADDVTIRLARLVIIAFDAVTITESLTVFGPAIDILGAVVFDELVALDSVTVFLTKLVPTVFDTVTMTENVTVAISSIGLSITVFDGVTVAEAVETQTNPMQINEFTELVITESVTVLQNLLRIDLFDTITVAESVTMVLFPILLSVNDTVSVAERVVLRIGKGKKRRHDLPVVGVGD